MEIERLPATVTEQSVALHLHGGEVGAALASRPVPGAGGAEQVKPGHRQGEPDVGREIAGRGACASGPVLELGDGLLDGRVVWVVLIDLDGAEGGVVMIGWYRQAALCRAAAQAFTDREPATE